eukprot:1196056-Prorocentrum_minimum.AAC.5
MPHVAHTERGFALDRACSSVRIGAQVQLLLLYMFSVGLPSPQDGHSLLLYVRRRWNAQIHRRPPSKTIVASDLVLGGEEAPAPVLEESPTSIYVAWHASNCLATPWLVSYHRKLKIDIPQAVLLLPRGPCGDVVREIQNPKFKVAARCGVFPLLRVKPLPLGASQTSEGVHVKNCNDHPAHERTAARYPDQYLAKAGNC